MWCCHVSGLWGRANTERDAVLCCDCDSGSWGVWEACEEITERQLWESVAVRSLNALDHQAQGCSDKWSVMRP